MRQKFRRLACTTAEWVGSPLAFIGAIVLVVVWAAMGPVFHYSDTWQLVINTGTTILTFLMVFLIQATQNRDATAIHLKLDELIRGVKGARTRLVRLEEFSDEELTELQEQFHRLHDRLADPNGGAATTADAAETR
ncbi:MAG TPA: low affinity iron permease family protein [Methylomirabilota bacterium]